MGTCRETCKYIHKTSTCTAVTTIINLMTEKWMSFKQKLLDDERVMTKLKQLFKTYAA